MSFMSIYCISQFSETHTHRHTEKNLIQADSNFIHICEVNQLIFSRKKQRIPVMIFYENICPIDKIC